MSNYFYIISDNLGRHLHISQEKAVNKLHTMYIRKGPSNELETVDLLTYSRNQKYLVELGLVLTVVTQTPKRSLSILPLCKCL